MKYFQLFKFAQIENFLRQKGFSENFVALVLSKPKNIHKAIGKIINDNPNLTEYELIGQIEAIPTRETVTKQPKTPKYNPQMSYDCEIKIAQKYEEFAEFKKWVLISLKKLRNEVYQTQVVQKKLNLDQFNIWWEAWIRSNIGLEYDRIIDWYRGCYLPAKRELKENNTPETYGNIPAKYGLANPSVNLMNLSYQDATVLSINYHEWLEGRSEGLFYMDEKPDDIVYGPKWENEKFNGWTIKEVKTRNNLKTEGEKMDHCVGGEGYCQDVSQGKARIFSLRDPSNKPHVTMEVRDDWEFRQVFGPNNSNPKSEYKMAVGEWLKTLPSFYFTPVESDEYFDYENIDDYVKQSFEQNLEEYGIKNKPKYEDPNHVYDYVMDRLEKHNRQSRYDTAGGPKMDDAAALFAKGLISNYKHFDFASLDNKDKMIEMSKYQMASEMLHPFLKRIDYDFDNILSQIEWYKKIFAQSIEHQPPKSDPYYDLEIETTEQLDKVIEQYKNIVQQYLEAKKIKNFAVTRELMKSLIPLKFIVGRLFSLSKRLRRYSLDDFETLPSATKLNFITEAINKQFSIGLFLGREEKNFETLNEAMDRYYEPSEAPPDREDFETEDDFAKAEEKFYENEDKQRDAMTQEYAENNTPYCFDKMVRYYLEKMLSQENLSMPEWIKNLYASEKKSLPECLLLIDNTAKQKIVTSGWYLKTKMSFARK
jgi:hypothetical protein